MESGVELITGVGGVGLRPRTRVFGGWSGWVELQPRLSVYSLHAKHHRWILGGDAAMLLSLWPTFPTLPSSAESHLSGNALPPHKAGSGTEPPLRSQMLVVYGAFWRGPEQQHQNKPFVCFRLAHHRGKVWTRDSDLSPLPLVTSVLGREGKNEREDPASSAPLTAISFSYSPLLRSDWLASPCAPWKWLLHLSMCKQADNSAYVWSGLLRPVIHHWPLKWPPHTAMWNASASCMAELVSSQRDNVA